MDLTMLKAKIHRAVVTEADIHYVGSITIDEDIMDAAGLLEYEAVHVVDVNNGNRLETYVIRGPRGKGDICLNGAAARLVHVGDAVIIMAYCRIGAHEAPRHEPKIVFIGKDNQVVEIDTRERHGQRK